MLHYTEKEISAPCGNCVGHVLRGEGGVSGGGGLQWWTGPHISLFNFLYVATVC